MWMAEFGGLPPLLLAASYQSDSATFNSGQWPSPVPALVCTVCTGDPSYWSGSKGVKSVILGQKAKFSPTAEKNAWRRCAISCAVLILQAIAL